MSKRALSVSILTAGLTAGVIAGAISPAAAQGEAVDGSGNVYFLSGAGNTSGQAQKVMVFGDPGDEVYFGDWDKDGTDSPMVRRGNAFFVADQNGKTVNVFSYGDAGDDVLVGDWDGDGADSLAVRRANKFFVKNDNQKSGKADKEFYYGDAGDTVLVGDWNKDGKDTLIVRRNAEYHVKNDTESGKAEYTFVFGEANDTILVGDWSNAEKAQSGDGADQLAVRRGFEYHLSSELGAGPLKTERVFGYGNPDDNVFVTSLPTDTGKVDEIRPETYTADEAAKYKAGDVIWTVKWDASLSSGAGDWVYSQKLDEYGKVATAAGGEAKTHLPDEVQYYRGGEPVIGWNGAQEKWTQAEIDAFKNVKHAATDYRLAGDGSVARFSPAHADKGEPMSWAQSEAAQKIDPYVTAVTAKTDANYLDVKAGDPKVRRAGEPMVTSINVQAEHTGNSTDYVTVHAATDLDLDDKGNVQFDSSGALKLEAAEYKTEAGLTTASTTNAALHKKGDKVVARPGQIRLGWTWTSGAGWASAPIDGTTKGDEDANTYIAPSFSAPLVSSLDNNDTKGPGYYLGGETIYADATAVGNFKGGESVLSHKAGDPVLDEKGNVKMTGTGKAIVITGDGLGVRRHIG